MTAAAYARAGASGLSAFDRAIRETGIGASEAHKVVLGQGALEVYERLVEPHQRIDEPSIAMREGTALEPMIADLYSERTGLELVRCETLRHPRYPFILATPDRQAIDHDGTPFLVEIKRPKWRSADEWGDGRSWAAEICVPRRYLIQCVVQMAVADLDRVDLVALIEGEEEIRVFRIPRDLELEQLVVERLVGFWYQHIEPRDPPAADGSSAAAAYLQRRYPRDRLPLLPASDDDRLLGEELASLRTQRKAIEAREAEIENTLKARCGDAAGIESVCTWKAPATGHVAWKGLAMELGATPAQIAHFTAAPARRFLLSRKLGG